MEQDALLNKLQNLKTAIKDSLRKKGMVVPVKTKRGLKLDDYTIELAQDGYVILNKWGDAVYSKLFYIKTAVLVANALALRREVKQEWITSDFKAGTTEFDVKVFDRRFISCTKKQDMFGMGHYSIRLSESRRKHKVYMDQLNNAYLRLLNGVKSLEKTAKYS